MSRSVRTSFSFFSLLIILTLLAGVFIPVGSVQARTGGGVSPISPTGYTSDTTPTFKWTKVTGAAWYKYELYKGSTFIYRKTVYPAACLVNTCQHTPTTILSHSSYKWRVRMYYGGVLQPWSSYYYFTITNPPADFNSQFNGSTALDWTSNPGGAWFVSSTALYTAGSTYKWSSNYRNTSRAYENFDFAARVKRTGPDVNYLAVRMGTAFKADNHGYPGYIFGYHNGGDYAIFKLASNGDFISIQGWTPTPYIVQNGWNELRVTAIGKHFTFYINGEPLIDFNDVSFATGSVGFAMYKNSTTATNFQVDWAYARVLLASAVRTGAAVSPAQLALNLAVRNSGVVSSPEGPSR